MCAYASVNARVLGKICTSDQNTNFDVVPLCTNFREFGPYHSGCVRMSHRLTCCDSTGDSMLRGQCTFLLIVGPRMGLGYPLSAFAPSLSIHFLIFCSLLFFPFFLFSFTLLIFFYCPFNPCLPESSCSVSRHEVVLGDRTWV